MVIFFEKERRGVLSFMLVFLISKWRKKTFYSDSLEDVAGSLLLLLLEEPSFSSSLLLRGDLSFSSSLLLGGEEEGTFTTTVCFCSPSRDGEGD
jgi:hypothetical protein